MCVCALSNLRNVLGKWNHIVLGKVGWGGRWPCRVEERRRREEPDVSPSLLRFLVGHVNPQKEEWWSVKRKETSLRSLTKLNIW